MVQKIMLVCAVFLMIPLAACQVAAEPSVSETVTVTEGTLTKSITATGGVQATRQVTLSLGVSGTVKSVPVSVGDSVGRNATLVTLQTADWERRVDGAVATLESAEAALKNTRTQLRLLDENDEVKPDAVDNLSIAQLAQLKQVESQWVQAKNALEDAKASLEKTTLKAPFAGLVTQLWVNPGEVAAASRAVALIDPDSLRLVVEIDEADRAGIALNQSASVEMEAYPNVMWEGVVTAIAPAAATNTATGAVTYAVQIALTEQEDYPLYVGMTGEVTLVTAEYDNVLLVPNRAISYDNATRTYLVHRVTATTPSIVTEEVAITVGQRNNTYTEVKTGIANGDKLAIDFVAAPTSVPRGGPLGGG